MKALIDWRHPLPDGVGRVPQEDVLSEHLKRFSKKKTNNDFETLKFDESLTMVGIEVEMENYKGDQDENDLIYWAKDVDPSLRNSGIELRSVVLPSQKYVAAALTELSSFLKAQSRHDFSWRTSIHVHLDITRLNLIEFCNFFLVYCSLEPLLFKVFAEERRNSVYCVPLFESSLLTNKRESALLANLFKSAKDRRDFNWGSSLGAEWSKDVKYSAINFFRLSDLGTVEFRHLAGTNKIERIRDWISALISMLGCARGYNEKVSTLAEIIKALNTKSNYFNYLESIFGDLTKLVIIPDYEQYMVKGVRKCKEILASHGKVVSSLVKVSDNGAVSKHIKEIKEKQQQRLKRTYD